LNDPELVKSFALICAAESTGILPEQLHELTVKRNIAHSRFIAMALMDKYCKMSVKQIACAFDCRIKSRYVYCAIKIIRDQVDLFNRKGIKTELFIQYRKSNEMMKQEFKQRYWAKVPDYK
jgi:hypothetical protein